MFIEVRSAHAMGDARRIVNTESVRTIYPCADGAVIEFRSARDTDLTVRDDYETLLQLVKCKPRYEKRRRSRK